MPWPTTLTRPLQSYLSRSHNPLTNLSIEHHLLQHTPPSSAVLFLYLNAPSIILGRNQNPWRETNLHALRQPRIHLVRRRSGGGTVFHDLGNVNWSIIVPTAAFTRDKHAEMVVRALRGLGVERARVNERHDVVLDRGVAGSSSSVDPDDTHATRWTRGGAAVKVSGSAYKLTRGRALHHGTCLLQSTNLAGLSALLRAPGRDLIEAKGVESVSSPVDNVGVGVDEFVRAVQDEFAEMYGAVGEVGEVGDEALQVASVSKGVEEMQSAEWVFGQTPAFTFDGMVGGQRVALEAKHGRVLELQVGGDKVDRVEGRSLAEAWMWTDVIPGEAGRYLDSMVPTAGTLGFVRI